jgi:hypothetical protein
VYGLILDMYRGTRPSTVSVVGTLEYLRALQEIDPDYVATSWMDYTVIEPKSVRSKKTGEVLPGAICEHSDV